MIPTRRWQAVVWVAALALALASCDRGGGASGDPSQAGAKPGHLTGKLADAQGKPLSNVTVTIFGFSDNGEPIRRETKIAGPAAAYDLELPAGKYNTPVARINVPDYNGRAYDLPLAAADNTREWTEQKEARRGMVRDFVWRISGPVPGGQAESPTGYWGGSVQFDKSGEFADSATIEITLKPDGPLIDGSEGKTLVYTRKLPWKKHADHYLFDVPIGRYTATARIPYGTRPKPLRLIAYTIDLADLDKVPSKPLPNATVDFECRETKPGEFTLQVPNLIAFPPL
jgi:hypothetical protein